MHNPGDVEIHQFSIGGQDVRPRVSQFSVYEHVMKPYTAVVAQVVDNADLLNRLFSSDVEMTLSFGQPGQDPYVGTFAVTSVERGKSMENLRTAAYTVTAYSRHMTRFPRVQKAYREATATDVVRDLVQSFLAPDKPVLVRDPSRGVMGHDRMPYNVNGVQIHKAIRAVLERGVSSKNSSSAYVLFETRGALVVDTLESMLDRAFSSPRFTYFQRPMGENYFLDQVRQNFTILTMREEARSDRTDRFQAENQEVNPFDVFSHEDDRSNVGDRKLASTIVNMAYNSMRPPTELARVLPERKRVASEFDSQSLSIHVPLNAEMTVGDGINIELLAPLGDTDGAVRDSISGPLLITELRHTVNLGRERLMGTTTMRGTRGGRG